MIRRALENGAQESGLEISAESLGAFEIFTSELLKWNRKVNLTAITSANEIAAKHIIDSLFLARLIDDSEKVLDVGSGAGIPAIPLKIVKPGAEVVSVDAVAKKIHFQRHVARLLRMQGFEALHARVEELHNKLAGRFDVVTSRAFTDLGRFAILAAPLLAAGGRLIAMKGPGAGDELGQAADILATLGFEISAIYPYNLPFNSGERRLIVLKACNPA